MLQLVESTSKREKREVDAKTEFEVGAAAAVMGGPACSCIDCFCDHNGTGAPDFQSREAGGDVEPLPSRATVPIAPLTAPAVC